MKRTMYEKLFKRLFVFALVALIILATLFTALMIWGNRTQSKDYTDETAQQISNLIDDYFDRLNSMTVSYLATRNLSTYLNRLSLSYPVTSRELLNLKETISIFLMFEPGMEMCVMSNEGVTELWSMSAMPDYGFIPLEDPVFQALAASEKQYTICFNYDPPYTDDALSCYVSVIYKISEINNQNNIAGYLSLNINSRLFTSMIRRMTASDYDYYVIYPDGLLAYSNNGFAPTTYDSLYTSPLTGISVGVRSQSKVWWRQFVMVIIALLLMVLLFEAIFLYMLREGSLKIINPIYRLIAIMQRVRASNDLDVYLEYDGDSPEIREMYRSFNDLVISLRAYIRENQTKELLLVKANLDSLVEKINPHFLYNVLETISAQALVDSSPTASRMCRMLGDMFRYNLRPDESVPLRCELEAVENYIQMHNLSSARCACRYSIDVPEEYSDLRIPKLALQPIVENAFKHGFRQRVGEGRLSINLFRESGVLVLRVQDDGCGMTEAELDSLRARMRAAESLAPHDTETGYGVRYTHVRLKLFFGEDYETRISSGAGGGLTVCLCIPDRVKLAERTADHDSTDHN